MHLFLLLPFVALYSWLVYAGFGSIFSPIKSMMDYMERNHPKVVAKSMLSLIAGYAFMLWLGAEVNFKLGVVGYGFAKKVLEKFHNEVVDLGGLVLHVIHMAFTELISGSGAVLLVLVPFVVPYMALGAIVAVVRSLLISWRVLVGLAQSDPAFVVKAAAGVAFGAGMDYLSRGSVNVTIVLAGSVGFLIYVLWSLFFADE